MNIFRAVFNKLRRIHLTRRRERAYTKGRWRDTTAACRRLLELDPGDRKALHDLAVSLWRSKDQAGALAACRRLFETAPRVRADLQCSVEGPRYLRYILVYAKLLIEKRAFDQARLILDFLKKMGTHFHDKFFLLSRIRRDEGDLAGAASELEEMAEIYASRDIPIWEAEILLRCRQIMELSGEKRDPDAALIASRTLSAIHRRRGDLEERLRACGEDPKSRLEALALRAHEALAAGDPAAVGRIAEAIGWPEFEDALRLAAAGARGDAEECLRGLKGLPPSSLLHLQLARRHRALLWRSAEGLRDFAETHLAHGRVEEAYEAAHALSSCFSPGLADLERLRDLRSLLLDRALFEDEARLGLHPDPDLDVTRRVLPAGPEAVSLSMRGRQVRVLLSASYRLGAPGPGGDGAGDLDDVRCRLAENYLRRGVRTEEAVRLLQELSIKDKRFQARALSRIALAFIRKGPREAAAAAVSRLLEAEPSPRGEAARLALLETGEACEAAGLLDDAKRVYGALLAADVAYADVQRRLQSLEDRRATAGGARPAAAGPSALERLRERFADLVEIGRGGMGVVYRAYDPLFNRPVAVKALSEAWRGDPEAAQRFVREAQAMAQLLRHPGITQIYEVGLGEDLYICMEFVPGRTLRALLKERGRLPPSEAAALGALLCEPLGAAHSSGVLHRDVKPDNVLLVEGGGVKIADFGLAAIAGITRLTEAGSRLGTPFYMPPEQIRGEALDARSDVYALGATLFEIAAGRPPFPDGDVAYRHVHEPAPPLGDVAPGAPASLEAAVARCLEKDPGKRWPSCAELARALRGSAN